MKPDLQIYFEANEIESLVGTVWEVPDTLCPSTVKEHKITGSSNLLSFFRFVRSNDRYIKLSEQVVCAARAFFLPKVSRL